MAKKEIRVLTDILIDCPMLKRPIPDSFCCDINQVVDRNASKEFVPEFTDWELAKKMCPGCPVSWLTLTNPSEEGNSIESKIYR